MANNISLGAAKVAKNDEFYTQYADIQKEVNAYLEYNPDTFRDKVVLLPCDDPEWSNFTKFFAQNFEMLGLKKLISTSYAAESKKYKYYEPSLFETESPLFDADKTRTHGKIFILDRDTNGNGHIDIDDLQFDYLDGDGDFRSPEVCKLRDEADMIVTNPPFSLFRVFLSWLIDANKELLIIGNQNSVSSKDIFLYIQADKLWLGVTGYANDMVFGVPKGAEVDPKDKAKAAKMGYIGDYTRLGNSCWFTNLDHGRRHQPIQLMTMKDNLKFSKHRDLRENGYLRYDNYDAINVGYNDAIPSDYDGAMGVPITFLDRYCPEQFEILGLTQIGCHDALPDTRRYNDYKEINRVSGKATGSSGGKTNENAVLPGIGDKKTYYLGPNGEMVHSEYKRILIRRRK